MDATRNREFPHWIELMFPVLNRDTGALEGAGPSLAGRSQDQAAYLPTAVSPRSRHEKRSWEAECFFPASESMDFGFWVCLASAMGIFRSKLSLLLYARCKEPAGFDPRPIDASSSQSVVTCFLTTIL